MGDEWAHGSSIRDIRPWLMGGPMGDLFRALDHG